MIILGLRLAPATRPSALVAVRRVEALAKFDREAKRYPAAALRSGRTLAAHVASFIGLALLIAFRTCATRPAARPPRDRERPLVPLAA
jgi:hypothetical protein